MMDAFVPRFRATEESLLAGLHWQLEQYGCVAVPAGFRAYRGAQAAALLAETEPGQDADGADAAAESKTGPNKVDENGRTVSGVANVLSISRSGIRLSIKGLDLDHYNQHNPVVLAGHRTISAGLLPGAIGTVERAYKAKEQTELRFRNLRFDTDPIAEAWYQKVLSGTVRMVSVGFLPLEVEVATETVGSGNNKREVVFLDIPSAELLEISVVAIGANRGALIGQFGQHAHERLAQVEAAVARLLSALGATESADESAMTKAIARLEKAAGAFHGQPSNGVHV